MSIDRPSSFANQSETSRTFASTDPQACQRDPQHVLAVFFSGALPISDGHPYSVETTSDIFSIELMFVINRTVRWCSGRSIQRTVGSPGLSRSKKTCFEAIRTLTACIRNYRGQNRTRSILLGVLTEYEWIFLMRGVTAIAIAVAVQRQRVPHSDEKRSYMTAHNDSTECDGWFGVRRCAPSCSTDRIDLYLIDE